MKNTPKFLMLFLSALLFQFTSLSQVKVASGNFGYPDFEITTSPKTPTLCPDRGGLKGKVKCEQEFSYYKWTHSASETVVEGISKKEIQITQSGQWKLEVTYRCDVGEFKKSITFTAYDLSDPEQIKKYFETEGFYAIPIWRDEIQLREDDDQQNRTEGCDIQAISLKENEASEDIVESSINSLLSEFPPIKDDNPGSVLSKNSCLCELGIEKLISDYNSKELSLWLHTYFGNEEMKGIMFLKGKLPGDPHLPIETQIHHFQTSLHQEILDYNGNNSSRLYAVAANIFLPHPIEGYTNDRLCSFVINPNNTYLTPAGVPIQFPNGNYKGYFASEENEDKVFQGAIAWIGPDGRNGESYQGFRFKNNRFEGYVHEESGIMFNGFAISNSTSEKVELTTTYECQGSCKLYYDDIDGEELAFKEDGGINFKIKQYNYNKNADSNSPTYLIYNYETCIPEEFKNNDKKSVSFLTPKKDIITLPCTGKNCNEIMEVEMLYGAITDKKYDPNRISGTIKSFRLKLTEFSPSITYVFNDGKNSFTTEDGSELYPGENLFTNTESFVFSLSCGDEHKLYKFSNFGNLPKYNSESEENYYYDFIGFAEDLNLFTIQYPMQASTSIPTQNGCPWCVGELTKLITENYCETPEQIYLDKIAEIATVNSKQFQDNPNELYLNFGFTQKGHWEYPRDLTIKIYDQNVEFNREEWKWGEHLNEFFDGEKIENLYNTNNRKFFKAFLIKFKEYIENTSNNFWAIIESKNIDQIVSHLRYESQYITSQQPYISKKQVAFNTLHADVNFKEPVENAIIHIIAACKGSEDKDVLKDIENKGIDFYWARFHDIGGADNLTGLFTLISSKIYQSGTGKIINISNYYNNASNFISLEADLWNWNNLQFNIVLNNIEFNQNTYNFRYNDIIPIKVTGTFEINGQTYQKGKILLIPAIQAALFAHSNNKAVAERTGWVAIDIGFFAIGVGSLKMVYSSANYFRKAFIVSDLIGSAAGISAGLLDNDAIDQSLRDQIQLVAFALSAPEAGISIFEAITKSKLLRNNYPTIEPAIYEANNIRQLAAETDLKDFPDALNFVKNNSKGFEAWELSIEFQKSRRKKLVLERLATKYKDVLQDIKNTNEEFLESSIDHLDLGGHNRYPSAVKIVTDPVDYSGLPIKNHLEGQVEVFLPKFETSSIDKLTAESFPITLEISNEMKRVIKNGGQISIMNNQSFVDQYVALFQDVTGNISYGTFTDEFGIDYISALITILK